MRIVNMQRFLRERGRIRLGYSTPRDGGGKRPHKLDKFLFSAPDRETIDDVARLYGGKVEQWEGGARDRFRVITNVDAINVVLPAQMAFSQCYEQYRNGFPVVRCDGERCLKPGPGKRLVESPCECDPDERACQTTTHLSLVLPELAGLGTWRLVSHGWYAAVELSTVVDLIEQAMSIGMRVPARLFLERREVRRLIDGKPEVRKFVVPALDLSTSITALGGGGLSVGAAGAGVLSEHVAPALAEAPVPTGWRGVREPAALDAPLISAREQIEANEVDPARRANAAPPIPATGRAPRTAAQADDSTCSLCAKPYGTGAALVRNPEPGASRFVHRKCLDDAENDDWIAGQEDDDAQDVPSAAGPADGNTGDRGGVASEAESPTAPAEPAPVTAPYAPLTAKRKGEMFAVLAEALPKLEGEAVDVANERRRLALLDLARLLGQPDIDSRTQINARTGRLVIDALRAMAKNELRLVDGQLYDAGSGVLVDFEGWAS